MNSPKFLFGDIVVVNENQIGVIVKSWQNTARGNWYEVYNRMTSSIVDYEEFEIERYKVRHKYLNEEEMDYQSMC